MPIDGSGEIIIGKAGPPRWAATAFDEAKCLAMVVRQTHKSFQELLTRLDSAIADAVEEQLFVDRING